MPIFVAPAPVRAVKDLDAFDVRLLDLLQLDALMTAEALAAQVPLSASAITRRVRRLRSEGWIERDVAIVSRRLSDARLRAMVLVTVQEHAEERGLAALRARLVADPCVQLLLDVAGAHDLAVLVSARDMADFNAITARLFECEPAVRRYDTHFVKRVHKQSAAVVLD